MLDTLPSPQRDAASVDAPLVEAAPAARWNAATRVAFRFCFVYFTLYVLTGSTGWMRPSIEWTAAHVFHVSYQYSRVNTGSGDKMIDWIHAFLLLAFAIGATIVWSALDRRRPNYASLHKWFHLFLRFAAGTTMAGYGMVKAIPLQMPAPNLTRLLEPFGNFSPMGVLWYSVGASFPYERFAGAMELTAAILLFIPRLSMLGAMVLIADAVQIFTLNMAYDVPVKLFAFHLVVMGFVLLAPDLRRLTDVLVLNRSVGPSPLPPLVTRASIGRVIVAAQLVFGALVIGAGYVQARESWFSRGFGAPKPPLYGIWTVEKMTVDGVERSPLITDWGRWRRVIVQNAAGGVNVNNAATVAFWRMDDTFVAYPSTVDTTAKSIALTKTADKSWNARFTFEQPAPDRLVLDGTMDGHAVHLETRLFDRNNFLLVNRGFHWIQESPFNR